MSDRTVGLLILRLQMLFNSYVFLLGKVNELLCFQF